MYFCITKRIDLLFLSFVGLIVSRNNKEAVELNINFLLTTLYVQVIDIYQYIFSHAEEFNLPYFMEFYRTEHKQPLL